LLLTYILLAIQNQKSCGCTLRMGETIHQCTTTAPPINIHKQQCHAHLLEARWIVVTNLYVTSNAEPKKPWLHITHENQSMHCSLTSCPFSQNGMHTFWKCGGLVFFVIYILLVMQYQNWPSCTSAHGEKQSTNASQLHHDWLHLHPQQCHAYHLEAR